MYEEIYRILESAPDPMYDWCAEFDGFPEEDKRDFASYLPTWKGMTDEEKCEKLIWLMLRRGEDMCAMPVK